MRAHFIKLFCLYFSVISCVTVTPTSYSYASSKYEDDSGEYQLTKRTNFSSAYKSAQQDEETQKPAKIHLPARAWPELLAAIFSLISGIALIVGFFLTYYNLDSAATISWGLSGGAGSLGGVFHNVDSGLRSVRADIQKKELEEQERKAASRKQKLEAKQQVKDNYKNRYEQVAAEHGQLVANVQPLCVLAQSAATTDKDNPVFSILVNGLKKIDETNIQGNRHFQSIYGRTARRALTNGDDEEGESKVRHRKHKSEKKRHHRSHKSSGNDVVVKVDGDDSESESDKRSD